MTSPVVERRECLCGKAAGGPMFWCVADRARGYKTCGCGAGPVRWERVHPMPGSPPAKPDLRTTPGQRIRESLDRDHAVDRDQMRERAVTWNKISRRSWALHVDTDGKIKVLVCEDLAPANIDALIDDLLEAQRWAYAVKGANDSAPLAALKAALSNVLDPAPSVRAKYVFDCLKAMGYTLQKRAQ